jgi:L-iduronidase
MVSFPSMSVPLLLTTLLSSSLVVAPAVAVQGVLTSTDGNVKAAVNVTVDCASVIGPLAHFWHSCGYSPAEAALRPDGVENTYRVGASPFRGISQVRIHFLLDLLVITGFVPNATAPGGYTLLYDWSLLDFAIDTLVSNRLSPGVELMGSPPGFPPLPTSFFTPWANNFKVSPLQTLGMFRAMVKAIAVRYAAKYGLGEVTTWNFETVSL